MVRFTESVGMSNPEDSSDYSIASNKESAEVAAILKKAAIAKSQGKRKKSMPGKYLDTC